LPTVPALPLTQTILSLTALRPRSEAWGPVVRRRMVGVGFWVAELGAVEFGDCRAIVEFRIEVKKQHIRRAL
jgi:hypothetical protein